MANIDFSQMITADEQAARAIASYQTAMAAAIDARVEATARQRNYNSAAHLASYVTSTVPIWAAEAAAFVAWRDSVWLTALTAMEAAQQTGVLPSEANLLAALPQIAWPQ